VGKLSSAMRTELLKPVPDVTFLLAITVGATTYRFSDVGAMYAGTGNYAAKVLSWGGGPARGVTLRNSSLELTNFEVMLDDTDQSLTTLLEGASRNSVRGAAATVMLASKNVASANWFTLYTGRVDTYGQSSKLTWTFQLSPNDLPLQRESLPKAKINVSDWPASKVDVRDDPVPILYGRISSSNGANDGAITCPYVDTGGFRYLVCAGWAKAVDTVYKDGTPVVASAYAITHPVMNGRTYTLIDFTSDQGATAVITCDAQGYETVGDGSGTLITDPPTILKHLLVNWIYGDYKTGPWLSDSTAPVDTTSFGTTFFSDRGYQSSVYISGAKKKGLEVVNDFLKSFEAKAYWTTAGKIALAVEDFTSWGYVTDYVVTETDDCGGWSLVYPTANLVDEIEAQYGQTPTGGYQQKLSVKDLSTAEQAPESVDLPHSAAFFL
jgi:hypothetical protein